MGPEIAKAFSIFLSSGAEKAAKIHDVFPIEDILEDGVWVDVGGGFGQFTVDVMRYLQTKNKGGRFVVEDQKEVLVHAPEIEGVEFLVQDFFEKQAVVGKSLSLWCRFTVAWCFVSFSIEVVPWGPGGNPQEKIGEYRWE